MILSKNILFILMVVKQWNRLSREAVESPLLEKLKTRLTMVLGSLLWLTLIQKGSTSSTGEWRCSFSDAGLCIYPCSAAEGSCQPTSPACQSPSGWQHDSLVCQPLPPVCHLQISWGCPLPHHPGHKILLILVFSWTVYYYWNWVYCATWATKMFLIVW